MRALLAASFFLLAAAAAQADLVAVGGRDFPVNYPFCGSWDNAFRGQALVLKTDALPAGDVTKWEWYASLTQYPGDFYKFRFKCCHTSKTALTETYADNYDGKTPVQVYYRETCHIAAAAYQWFGFQFDAPFAYNGADNLLFEVWWEGDNDGWAYTYWGSNPGRYVCSYIKGTTPLRGYPDKGEIFDYLHNMRITISPNAVAPTSLGRVKSFYR